MGVLGTPVEVIERLTDESAAVQNPDDLHLGNSAAAAVAALTGDLGSGQLASAHQAESRKFASAWVTLLLAFGVPLAWCYRQTLGRRPWKEDRPLRFLRS